MVSLPSKLMFSLDADQVGSEILLLDEIPFFSPSRPSFLLPCLQTFIAHIFVLLMLVTCHLDASLEDALAA